MEVFFFDYKIFWVYFVSSNKSVGIAYQCCQVVLKYLSLLLKGKVVRSKEKCLKNRCHKDGQNKIVAACIFAV